MSCITQCLLLYIPFKFFLIDKVLICWNIMYKKVISCRHNYQNVFSKIKFFKHKHNFTSNIYHLLYSVYLTIGNINIAVCSAWFFSFAKKRFFNKTANLFEIISIKNALSDHLEFSFLLFNLNKWTENNVIYF